ncbi:hypothetical protein EON81_22540 [bacterium]|nr:MAG: hypothetical protein EON81_22540 [bacterium]
MFKRVDSIRRLNVLTFIWIGLVFAISIAINLFIFAAAPAPLGHGEGRGITPWMLTRIATLSGNPVAMLFIGFSSIRRRRELDNAAGSVTATSVDG